MFIYVNSILIFTDDTHGVKSGRRPRGGSPKRPAGLEHDGIANYARGSPGWSLCPSRS
jgi:hypothetical protein